jgi:hypothetical protein
MLRCPVVSRHLFFRRALGFVAAMELAAGVANVNLELLAGSNTITISSISGETAPDLDSIIVVE